MRIARLAALVAGPLLLSACQRYTPAPLDLAAHPATVGARDITAAGVADYARRLGASGGAAATEYNPSDGLSLDEAEVVALFFNPQLRLARLRADVPRVGAAEAGRWEDPELGIDGERIVESVEHPWVLGGTLSFTIPLSGRLGVERKKAEAEATTEELRALAAERRVLAELRAEWIEWSATVERAALTRQIIAELDGLVERADRLREAGELDPVNARLLRLERAKQAAQLQGYDADARTAEIRVKARLGLMPAANVALVPSLTVAPPPPSVPDEQVRLLVAEHPRVRVVRAEYEVAERALELEVRKQYPDLRIGGGFGTDEGDNRVLFGAGLPLPIFNANRRAIAEATAKREVTRAAAEAEYEQLLAEAAAARSQLDGARARLDRVERELGPLADQQVEDVRRLGRAGDFDAIVLLEAVRAAHEAKLQIIDARLAVGLAGRGMQALLESGTPPAAPPAGKDRP
jgi:outer membrane protein, heavy metal efflux system